MPQLSSQRLALSIFLRLYPYMFVKLFIYMQSLQTFQSISSSFQQGLDNIGALVDKFQGDSWSDVNDVVITQKVEQMRLFNTYSLNLATWNACCLASGKPQTRILSNLLINLDCFKKKLQDSSRRYLLAERDYVANVGGVGRQLFIPPVREFLCHQPHRNDYVEYRDNAVVLPQDKKQKQKRTTSLLEASSNLIQCVEDLLAFFQSIKKSTSMTRKKTQSMSYQEVVARAEFSVSEINNFELLARQMCLCRCCEPCSQIVFNIMDINKTIVGQIKNVYESTFKEVCTKADKFWIHFPNDSSINHKLLIVYAALFIDYEKFENTCCNMP